MGTKHRKKIAPTVAKQSTTATNTSQPRTQEKKTFTINTWVGMGIALIVTFFIVAISLYYLIERNSDVLWMAQEKEYFTSNALYLKQCMHQPGGFIGWVAAFLTQFFYHPKWGACIMVAIWVASMWMSKFAFKVKAAWMAILAIPVVCLLVSMVDNGYWVYYTKQTGFWFYGTVGYFMAILMMLFHSFFDRKRFGSIITTTLVAFTYPIGGWYTLLALAYISARNLAKSIRLAIEAHKHPHAKSDPMVVDDQPQYGSWYGKILMPLYPWLLILLVPLVCRRFYAGIRLEDAWILGFPAFENDLLVSQHPVVPFMFLAAIPLLFPFLPKGKDIKGFKAVLVCLVTIAMMVCSYMWVDKNEFKNYNYHAEIRMYKAAEEQDWDKVLDEMGGIPGDASREMVLLKNVALLNTGEIGNKMFHYNNMGEPPVNGFDTLNVHMVQTAAPLLYYYHGKTNFASRWCIENSVEFGYDFGNLKMLARCALVNGEMDVAKKYLNILKTSLFYDEWAEKLLPITDKPELIKEYHEFDAVRELRDHMGTVLDGDNGLCEMYLLNYFSNTMNKDDKLLQELTLDYALIQKDIQLFWPRFFLYAELHQGEAMPTHYQEAAYLYGHLEPQNVNISNMPFDKTVKERYEGFQQLSQSLLNSGMQTKDVGEAMKSSYGDTFYWFYFFCRDVHSY
ncbi:MAG: hypothetical protein J5616_05990 [Bacteroidaceae bacterium]|nr:hypothetical protein [Bacteroidaceae bacterium]